MANDEIRNGFRSTFRDFETDGVPSSGKRKVSKADGRGLGDIIADAIDAIDAGYAVDYETRALLFADLTPPADSLGRVFGDATEGFRGIYQKSGASGSGSWTRIGPLPGSELSGKLDNTMTTARMLGRTSSGTGPVQELSSATARGFLQIDTTIGTATQAAIDNIRDDVPRNHEMAHAFEDKNGILLGGIRADGQLVSRSASGALVVGFGGSGSGSADPTDWDHVWDDAGTGNATIAPTDGRLRVFLLYGQSYSIGTIDSGSYAAASPYNSTAFDAANALMPSVGLLVATNFSTLTGLFEQKNGNGATVETVASEWVKGVLEGWDAAGLSRSPIAVCASGIGGTPVQNLMVGSDGFNALMTKLERMKAAAIAAGFTGIVVDALAYFQGEANRSDPVRASRFEWARMMAQLQEAIEYRARAISGQMEPVPMLISNISRNSLPAEINSGAILAAERSPNKIILLNPNYACEHTGTDTHPTVSGYRRLGRYCAKATLGAVYGVDYRPMLPRRSWMHDTTHFRVEVELPKGASLIKDTSDTLVKTTGMDAGAGFRAFDASGEVTITGAAIAADHPASNAAYSGTIEVTFSSAPDEASLRVVYATRAPAGSGTGQGGLGGSVFGPRGLFRANDGVSVPDLAAATHSWLQPFEV